MFTITVETTFTAGHQLRLAGGNKEPLHSHDWVVRLAVSAEKIDEMGLAVDFEQLKVKLEDITAPFQGGQLEKLDYFKTNNASAEALAKYIFFSGFLRVRLAVRQREVSPSVALRGLPCQ